MQSIQRAIVFAFLIATLLVWVTIDKVLWAVADLANLPNPALIGSQFTASTLVGLLVALGAAVYAYMRNDVHVFLHDVAEELMKVAWPDWKTTRTATVTVIVTTLIVASMLGVFDWIWALLTGKIYSPG